VLKSPSFLFTRREPLLSKRILVLYYSQSGQLTSLAQSVASPLESEENIEVVYQCVKPVKPYPFPWPFFKFFSVFPETVAMIPPQMEPVTVADQEFDLIILAYTVWFLSPSLPITGFLRSDAAEKLLANKPVVTLIGCRNMWLMAQEKVKAELERLNARLVDNIALTDQCNSAASFLSTPLWMFTGKKQAVSWIPKAGIAPEKIVAATRFGDAIKNALLNQTTIEQSMLKGLGAVTINEKLIASEKVGQRSFKVWGKLMRLIGPQDSLRRRFGLIFYITFLVTIILTVVPITAALKWLLAPLTRKQIAKQKAYYAAPSGE